MIHLSNDQHVPAGSPQGGQFASKGGVNERDVSKLMKDIRGVQATTQKRAKHNEVAPNGETYRGGAFIATTEMPKKIRQKLEQDAKGKVRTATGFAVPEPGQMSIVDKLGGTVMNPRNGDINYQYMEYIGANADQVKRYESLAAKHIAGEQWVSVNDYPEIAGLVDAARLFVAGKPIPSAVLDKFKGNEAAERLKKYQQDKGMNLSASINLDRGTKGDEGHFVTINHRVVFLPDDHGTGANGRGGKFTKHGLEKKLMKHHESRGGFATHEHRDALAEDSGGDLQGRSQFTFHKTLPGEVRKHIENNPAARKLFRVTSNASDAKGADALASLGDKYFDLADEAAGGHMTQAITSAEKSDDPEARFHAAIYTNLPKTKTAQGIIAPNKLHEGHTFTINGTKMSVVRTDEGLHLEGHGYPSTPVDALSEIPIDKHSLKMGKKSVSREVVPFSAAIELSRKELAGGRWVTIHPHGGHGDGDYKRLYIKGDGTIMAGPKAMVGKNISHTHDTHETREKDHPQSPLKKESSFTAQTVDPNRQLGMFAKDKDGNAMEVGEKPGQASLFHDTAKAKPVVDKAQAKRDEDAKATTEMFPAKKAEDATDRREKMIRDAQALRYLAVKMIPDDMPTRAQLRVSDATTKGDIDKFIMQKYGVESDVARDASNQALTERGTHKLDGNKVTWTGGGDEPTAKTHPDVAKHIDSIIANATAPKPTAADIIAKQKKSDDVPESNDMDVAGMRDMGADKKAAKANPTGTYSTLADFEKDYEPMGRLGIHAMTYSGMGSNFGPTHGQGVSDIMQSVNEDRRHSLRSNPAMMSEANAYTDLRLASSQIERAKADPKVAKMIDRLRGPMAAKFVEMMAPGGELSQRPHMIENRLETLGGMSKPYAKVKQKTNLSRPSTLYLSAGTLEKDRPTDIPEQVPTHVNGSRLHLRWSDAAIAGKWIHPTRGIKIDIDDARISKWANGINTCLSRGVNLPICKDHKENADNVVGYIYGAKAENGTLKLLNGYIGQDSLKTARRNYLSVGIDPDFRDSYGNSYGEAIRHVALTPIPVISGQKGFIAASREDAQQDEVQHLVPYKETPMTDESLKKISDALGVEAVDEESAVDLACETLNELSREVSEANREKLELSAALDEAKAQTLELSAAEPVIVEASKADPELVKTKIELSAARGDITKYFADGLNKLIDSEPLLLSRESDGKPAIVLKFLELFDGAKLGAKSVEKTGVQMLSREVPDGGTEQPKPVNPYEDTIAKLNGAAK